MKNIDQVFDYLQKKTIKDVGSDYINDKFYLVFQLTNGSFVYISSFDDLYISVEQNVIN